MSSRRPGWECAQCTLQNKASSRSCDACGYSKSKSIQKEAKVESSNNNANHHHSIGPILRSNSGGSGVIGGHNLRTSSDRQNFEVVDLTMLPDSVEKKKPSKKTSFISLESPRPLMTSSSSSSSSSDMDNSVILIETKQKSTTNVRSTPPLMSSLSSSSIVPLRASQMVDVSQPETDEISSNYLAHFCIFLCLFFCERCFFFFFQSGFLFDCFHSLLWFISSELTTSENFFFFLNFIVILLFFHSFFIFFNRFLLIRHSIFFFFFKTSLFLFSSFSQRSFRMDRF